MSGNGVECLSAELERVSKTKDIGRVSAVEGNLLRVKGLGTISRIGDLQEVHLHDGMTISGEVIQLHGSEVTMMPDVAPDGVAIGDRVVLRDQIGIAPADSWIGRIIDPYGRPLDGKPLMRGATMRNLKNAPPAPAERRGMGARLETGMSIFNTVLPLVRGQRIGLFAGSGVGKSTLMGQFAKYMEADVAVIALVGERGRELREFVEHVLGPEGLARSIVIAATSDQSPLVRRRCAMAAMSVAEHFRDQGQHVVYMADSITRFAEAHREVAVSSGEMPALRGFPPSTSHMIMSLCERAGPGRDGQGDITGIFSVLVAGSDMEEPIADILRGVLDGHVVLDRKIAERGRFPAVDLLRSVSRSLPAAASAPENASIGEVRRLLGSYEQSATMIRAGLYSEGSDPILDVAIKAWPELDTFMSGMDSPSIQDAFNRLNLVLRRSGAKIG
ncbi:MAG: FliI/YscN family ATPase [Shimia sp.]|uniref:FliI/YscN family ATPase n=1 Tax=unclassified Shimia TaxID=2630038 RepID=UPI0006CD9DDB|nr:FliI/YscN family ATPase [Shimia sp. SK013]KPA20326.1 Flagellum-specific ATP synthase [Shimia sp. SK013]